MAKRGKVIRFPGLPPEPRDERGLVPIHRCDQAEALVVRALFESEANLLANLGVGLLGGRPFESLESRTPPDPP